MTPSADWTTELDVLLERLIEGGFTADDRTRLNAVLSQGAEPRRYYRGYMRLHYGLEWRIGEPSFCHGFSLPPERPPLGRLGGAWNGAIGYLSDHPVVLSNLVATVVLGIAIATAALIPVGSPSSQHGSQGNFVRNTPSPLGTKAAPGNPEPKIVSIARITGMADCVWVNENKAPFHNKIKLHDKFALKSGLMEITYKTGARVILQGPCTYEVESPAGGYLSLGKLTARVESRSRLPSGTQPTDRDTAKSRPAGSRPAGGTYFAVRTPTAVVTDLGTEFGVDVGETGGVETQVLDGTVQVETLSKDGSLGTPEKVRRGETIRVARKGAPIERITAIAAKTSPYVRHMPRPVVIDDDFQTVRDYLTSGAAGGIWTGILNAKTASRLDTQPFEIDGVKHSGRLVIALPEGANAGWSQPERGRTFKNAPYLYIHVPKGDFDARVRVVSQTEGLWSACGLMARLDDDNFISVDQNKFYGVDAHCGTHSQKAGKDTDANSYDIQIHGECCLRLMREGDAFRAYYSVAGKDSFWVPIPWGNDSMVMRRPELKGPMQVGLWYGTFSPIAGSVAFDDFSVQGEVVRQMEQAEKQKEK